MIHLNNILDQLETENWIGPKDFSVEKIEFDSRKISTNDVFVAIRGTQSNGHDFIQKAIEKGASLVICDTFPDQLNDTVAYVLVKDTNIALARVAANYYQNPSDKLKLVGITGTNGKTTIATLSYQMFKKAGFKVGLLSTVKIMVDDMEFPATHTTPDSLTINYYMSKMVEAGVTHCFMEVSSHGIHQSRTDFLNFSGGVFTNLSHDHLDYHASFKEYRDVKKSFFDNLPKNAFAITNLDDKNGPVMLQNTKAKKITYALKTFADYKAQILENQFSGLTLKINENEVWTQLIGSFNAYNLLAIYAIAMELGVEKIEGLRLLSLLESVSGRFQFFVSKDKVTTIVDYAHTPDALENVLKTINQIRSNNEDLITVVGCGGNRDKTKRPIMANIAATLSSKVILTSDNPRFEEPDTIIKEMEEGIQPTDFKKAISITDRFQAIKTACQLAKPSDIILIAGKGHETYQEIKGVKSDFDDLAIAKSILEL